MINLNEFDEEITYFTLHDDQGSKFCRDTIFEGIAEVKEKFSDYAETDRYDCDVANKWSVADCLENWQFTLYQWNGYTFEEVDSNNKILDFVK